MSLFEIFTVIRRLVEVFVVWILQTGGRADLAVEGKGRKMADNITDDEKNRAQRANGGESNNSQRATAKATVVGKDSDGHDEDVTAIGMETGDKSISEMVGNSNVELTVTGIKKGTAGAVKAVGFSSK